jgi:hypothetical protein
MNIDSSLILNIALGIIIAQVLKNVLKETFQIFRNRTDVPKVAAQEVKGNGQEANDEDWLDLWESVPQAAKEQSQRLIEDDRLRRRAQELNLWPYLWAAAPEATREKLRSRWNLARIQPSKTRA